MPSQDNVKRPTSRQSTAARTDASSAPAVKRTPSHVNKRQARAAARAAARQRRTLTLSSIAALLIVVALVLVLKDHLPTAASSTKGKVAAASGTASVCATATAAMGPVPAGEPPATPPPVSGKTVDGPSGLKYIDITEGCGAAVKAGDNVTVNYTGWLASDGTLFDSSLKSGRTPFQVQNVGQASVIPGWNLGLIGMKVGGERRLIIPPSLGYGAQGTPGGPIPPNATLIFDITVVSIG